MLDVLLHNVLLMVASARPTPACSWSQLTHTPYCPSTPTPSLNNTETSVGTRMLLTSSQ